MEQQPARKRPALFWLSALAAGLTLGVVSAAASVAVLGLQSERVGPWIYVPAIGTPAASHAERTLIAIIGLFALPRKETMYFNAITDSDGDLLRGDRTYRFETGGIDCRWWSVTVYGKNNYLIPNDEGRHSYNAEQLEKADTGEYLIWIGPEPRDGHWIPTGGAMSFDVTLRVYNPSDAFHRQLDEGVLTLPRLVKAPADG